MNTLTRCAPEVRERAVRMVLDHQGEHSSNWAAIRLVAGKIGCKADTLLAWMRRVECDTGPRSGLTMARFYPGSMCDFIKGLYSDQTEKPHQVIEGH